MADPSPFLVQFPQVVSPPAVENIPIGSEPASDFYLPAHRLTVCSARENEPRFSLSNSELRRIN
jgi:hypothetical protein